MFLLLLWLTGTSRLQLLLSVKNYDIQHAFLLLLLFLTDV